MAKYTKAELKLYADRFLGFIGTGDTRATMVLMLCASMAGLSQASALSRIERFSTGVFEYEETKC